MSGLRGRGRRAEVDHRLRGLCHQDGWVCFWEKACRLAEGSAEPVLFVCIRLFSKEQSLVHISIYPYVQHYIAYLRQMLPRVSIYLFVQTEQVMSSFQGQFFFFSISSASLALLKRHILRRKSWRTTFANCHISMTLTYLCTVT